MRLGCKYDFQNIILLYKVYHSYKFFKKFVILQKRLVFNFVKASFYQNDVLFDYSIKMPGFMPIFG
jgi:hypothetical protein